MEEREKERDYWKRYQETNKINNRKNKQHRIWNLSRTFCNKVFFFTFVLQSGQFQSWYALVEPTNRSQPLSSLAAAVQTETEESEVKALYSPHLSLLMRAT